MKYQVLIKVISNALSCSGDLDIDIFNDKITERVGFFFFFFLNAYKLLLILHDQVDNCQCRYL